LEKQKHRRLAREMTELHIIGGEPCPVPLYPWVKEVTV